MTELILVAMVLFWLLYRLTIQVPAVIRRLEDKVDALQMEIHEMNRQRRRDRSGNEY